MIRIFATFLFAQASTVAHAEIDVLRGTYWAPGSQACEGYIYHFDPHSKRFRVFTKQEVATEALGKFMSYQLDEGDLSSNGAGTYDMLWADADPTTFQFIDGQNAELTSATLGTMHLNSCDPVAAHQLISEAELHFKSCPKTVLSCKSQ